MVVERLGEVVAVVDEEAAAVQRDGAADHEVLRGEVGLDLVGRQLHDDGRVGGGHVAAVLGDLLTADEDGERVAAVVRRVHFAHLQGVVHKVELKYVVNVQIK